jgi:hypothetical protein
MVCIISLLVFNKLPSGEQFSLPVCTHFSSKSRPLVARNTKRVKATSDRLCRMFVDVTSTVAFLTLLRI